MSQQAARPHLDTDTSGQLPERGARRKKFAGYLKAANELRQSYQQSYGWRQNDGSADEDGSGLPGSFPELTSARHGDEEFILFPSYARRHQVRNRSYPAPGSERDIRSEKGAGDAEYWCREWEKQEDKNAVVDVDVRGWIFSPHRGPMGRKNRMMVGLARHLSGIPAPSNNSRDSSPQSSVHRKIEAHSSKHEELAMERVAEDLKRRGEDEANFASQGGYSKASTDGPGDSPGLSPVPSRSASPEKRVSGGSLRSSESYLYPDHTPELGSVPKRSSWNHPSDMSPAELEQANAHLMMRLKPFLTTPLVNLPLTVFFYNEQTSKSRTIHTNESGHFTLRAALDFVPTNVRVLASDKLSATEEVKVIDMKGISVISDVDDTIKHSAIGSGAKEIFRNTFVRELGDLTIEGVKEWYSKMASMGVTFHYVSNSPWQIFPLLRNFFALAGLPQGSFHLKQYNGMLQGIFEPVAERKKGTLEKIMNDFPERRFILVGDSGEADLELYTDILLSNPGRVLGVFIRDVTSTAKGFFDPSLAPLRQRGSQSSMRERPAANGSLLSRSSNPDLRTRPPLPPRQESRAAHSNTSSNAKDPSVGKLIDFENDGPEHPGLHRSKTLQPGDEQPLSRPSPPRPAKPLSMRSPSSEDPPTFFSQPAPPKPPARKPAPYPKPQQLSSHPSSDAISTSASTNSTRRSPLSQTHPASPPHSRSSSPSSTSQHQQQPYSYRAVAKQKVTSAYNAIPSLYSTGQVIGASRGLHGGLTEGSRSSSSNSTATTTISSSDRHRRPPPPVPPPPRRHIGAYPAAAAQYASHRINAGWNGNDTAPTSTNGSTTNPPANGNGNSNDNPSEQQTLSKKEELWKRRWARAQEIFREKGVLLRKWRRGEDVMADAVRLIEREQRRQQQEEEGDGEKKKRAGERERRG